MKWRIRNKNCDMLNTHDTRTPERRLRLPFGFYLIGTALCLITSAVNIQVPLYATYAEAAGKGVADNAIMFSMYIVGLIPTLIFFGGISDRIGRKPVLAVALTFAFLATLSTLVRPALDTLYVARVLQGVAVGLGVGTASAYLSELAPGRLRLVSTTIAFLTALGFGGGALFTSVLLAVFPSFTSLSYLILAGMSALTLTALIFFGPDSKPAGGSVLRLPVFTGVGAGVYVSVFIAWMVSGIVVAVIPLQLGAHGIENWIGPTLFLVNVVGVAMLPLVHRMDPQHALRNGYFTIPVGFALLIHGTIAGNIATLLAGAAVAGSACYGYTYLGGMTLVLGAAQENQARALSGYMLCAYLGFGLPSIALGYATQYLGFTQSLIAALIIVAAVSLVLAWGQLSAEGSAMRAKGDK